jgi:hypothetical protein
VADSNGRGNGGFKVIGTRPIQHDGVDKVSRAGQVRCGLCPARGVNGGGWA